MSLETGIALLAVIGLAVFVFYKKKNKAASSGSSGGMSPGNDNQQVK